MTRVPLYDVYCQAVYAMPCTHAVESALSEVVEFDAWMVVKAASKARQDSAGVTLLGIMCDARYADPSYAPHA